MELFKLLGTIAVDAAEALKAFKDTQSEGEKTESKLGKVFGAIGNGAVALGKFVGKGMVVGATACAGLAAAAVKSYADYEQLVGGVETLFGTRGAKSVEEYAQLVGKSADKVEAEFGMLQEAQSTVMQNAANAYKTAGLSANEYMETATSLAAALNQSSASQLDSANLADQAITDMSDNANKMGTSMEAIQNAYNGFSKQNYTMLDNLKLGYGGTKEEMQRLLDDAGKLQSAMGRKFDINNFADVTEAIHLMQVEMGISGISYKEYQKLVESGAMSEAEAFKLLGTTAKEANFTIAGSLNQLKGAWSNLMTGMADENANVGDLMNNLVESAAIALRNIIPRVTQALTGISTAITQIVPILSKEIPNLFQEALPSIIQAVVGLFNAVVSALPGITSAIQTLLPQIISGFMQIFTGLVEAIVAALPMIIDGILLLVDGLIVALPQIADALIGALPQIIEALVSALPTLIPQLIDGFVSMIMMLVESLPQIAQPIIDNLPTIIISIVDALVGNLPVLIEGLIQLHMGIVAALPQIIQALVDALPTVVALIVDALIQNIPLLIAGFIQVVGGLVAALPQIFSALIQGVGAIFSGLWEGIKTIFAPVTSWFSNMWSSLGNVPGLAQMKNLIETVWNAVKDYITTYINAIKNVISTVWNAIKNVISTVLNSIKNVISTAWNAIKTIISNVMKLISSVLKGDWEGVKSAISNILNAIKSVISSIWNGIKATISSVLNGIKSVVSSIWNGIKSVISSALNGIKSIVSSAWNNIKSAISKVLSGIINTVKGAASNMLSAGKDLVKGIWNGISASYDWIKGKIKGWVGNVTKFIKNLFGIKSPSTVMRDQVGRELARGVAVGIEDNVSEVEKAAEDMNQKILDAAQKRLDDHKAYNELTLAEEVGFWDEVRGQLAEGSEARISADKKYLEAKKSLNEQVLSAEQQLQNSLSEIYDKVVERKKSLLDTFDLFEEYVEGNEVPKSWAEMDKALDSQIKALEVYDTEMEKLEARISGTALWEELSQLGMDSLSQIQQINDLTDFQLQQYVEKYEKRAELAGKMAQDDLADETLEATQKAYQTFAETCDSLGLEVASETSAMQLAVTSAIDEMTKAFESFNPKMKMPHFSIKGTLDIESGSVPHVAVEWYKKAMSNATILSSPTIFGYDAKSGKYLGGGEAGNEVVAGEQTLMTMIQNAVAQQNTTVTIWLQKVFDILAEYFPQMLDAFEAPIDFNPNSMASALAVPMNRELGKLSSRKDRGR